MSATSRALNVYAAVRSGNEGERTERTSTIWLSDHILNSSIGHTKWKEPTVKCELKQTWLAIRKPRSSKLKLTGAVRSVVPRER
ncbi:MAG: hypothetical protein VYA18_12335, partial [Pseudomonadota bacterium]|nr:hypothetical protein [Pseudomonadota bacterium]